MGTEHGKTVPNVLMENEKARVFEVRFRPGDEHRSVPTSSFRVARALSGGTMMRTYADGTTKKVEWKTGEVRLNEPSKVSYSTRNVGETDVHLYIVELKEPRN
jgi:hypothetical protein